MTLASARPWIRAAATDAAEARVLAQDLSVAEDVDRARDLAVELERRTASLHRAALFACLALQPSDRAEAC